MKDFIVGLKILLVFSVVTGVLYPGIVTGYSLLFVSEKAHGKLIQVRGRIVGSEWLGQKFSSEKYFWSRPSSIDYNASSSGASNLGPLSEALKNQVSERTQMLRKGHPSETGPIPADLLFASGSGLDPDISSRAAEFQIERVSVARHIDRSVVQKLVREMTEKPQYTLFGEPRVNVLRLNLALDQLAP